MTMDRPIDISAGEFKAKCLKLMDEVAQTHQAITITKRGKPVARLVPIEDAAPRPHLFGYMAGTLTIQGDIVNVPHDAWSAETGNEAHLYDGQHPGRSKKKRKKRP